MHDLIEQCLTNQRVFLQSEVMCFTILSGGYEKYLQATLGYELYTRSNRAILTERNRCDFLGLHDGVLTAIEMGVNALPNARNGVINHIVANVNTVFRYDRAQRVYAIGVVDSLSYCPRTNHLDLVQYPERYALPFHDADTMAELDRVTESRDYFAHPSLETVRRFDFTTVRFLDYQMRLSFFVCGPFSQPLATWW
jgi:hypothetical protein